MSLYLRDPSLLSKRIENYLLEPALTSVLVKNEFFGATNSINISTEAPTASSVVQQALPSVSTQKNVIVLSAPTQCSVVAAVSALTAVKNMRTIGAAISVGAAMNTPTVAPAKNAAIYAGCAISNAIAIAVSVAANKNTTITSTGVSCGSITIAPNAIATKDVSVGALPATCSAQANHVTTSFVKNALVITIIPSCVAASSSAEAHIVSNVSISILTPSIMAACVLPYVRSTANVSINVTVVLTTAMPNATTVFTNRGSSVFAGAATVNALALSTAISISTSICPVGLDAHVSGSHPLILTQISVGVEAKHMSTCVDSITPFVRTVAYSCFIKSLELPPVIDVKEALSSVVMRYEELLPYLYSNELNVGIGVFERLPILSVRKKE